MTFTYLAEKYGTWFLGACLSVGMYVHKLYPDRLKEQNAVAKAERDKAKKEVEDMCQRLEKVEEVDKEAYPKFKELLVEVKELRETVKNHHETRFTGIVNDIGNMRDKVEYRFTSNEKAIADINRNFEKLQDKLDKNAEKAEQNFKDIDRSMKELLSAFAKNNRA